MVGSDNKDVYAGEGGGPCINRRGTASTPSAAPTGVCE